MLEPVGPLPPSVYWRRRCLALMAAVIVLALIVWGVAAIAGGDDSPPAPDPQARPASFVGPSPAPSSAPPSAAPPALAASKLAAPPGLTMPGLTAPPGLVVPPGLAMPPGRSGAPPPVDPRLAAALVTPPGGENGPQLGPDRRPPGAAPPTPSGPPKPPDPTAGPTPAGAAPDSPPRPCSDTAVRVTARTDKPRYAPGEKPVLSLVVTNVGPVACVRDLDAARQAVAVVRKPGDGLWSSNDCAPGHSGDVRTLAPGQEAVFVVRWSGRTSAPGCAAGREPVPPGAYQLLARLDRTISEPVAFILG